MEMCNHLISNDLETSEAGKGESDSEESSVNRPVEVPVKRYDHTVSRQLCVAAIIRHELPFDFVEYEHVRNWITYLNPDAMHLSRSDVEADVLKIYLKEKEELKQTLANIPNRICLTLDIWSGVAAEFGTICITEGYICLAAHFVDSNWKLNSKLLNFCHVSFTQTGFELSSKIQEFLCDWGIEKKIFSITLDYASANDSVQENLKSSLAAQNWLLCGGEFFQVRCSASILNLIAQEGLKLCSDALLDKIRESVKYVRGSKDRMMKFKECVATLGSMDTEVRLCLDFLYGWNRTYLMLARAVKYQMAFVNFQVKDYGCKCCPSTEEWKKAEKICEFLLPFYDITKLLSASSYPTSNLYFLQVYRIQCALQDSLSNEDEVIRSMGERMLVEFKKYWEEYSVVLALGAVLDPRIKFTSLEFLYSRIDSSTTNAKIEHVKGKLYKLFEEYRCANNSSSTTSNVQSAFPTTSSSSGPQSTGLNEWKHRMFGALHDHQIAMRIGKSQLDVYLEEGNLEFAYYEDLDVLEWWKDNEKRFPELSIMARDLLSIPITTVASESSFSIGAQVLNKYRSRLLPKSVQTLICARNWLHGFVCDDEDDDDDYDYDYEHDDDDDDDEENVMQE